MSTTDGTTVPAPSIGVRESVDISNDSVDIRPLKYYRCAKIFTTGQILHS